MRDHHGSTISRQVLMNDFVFYRLSKKDAMIISEEAEDMDESGAVQSQNETPNASPNKSFERKNSFLGKLFSSKKNKSGSSPNGGNGNPNGNKPEIGTFSAQFPPDAVLPPDASYSSAIYTPIRKPHQQSQQPTTTTPPPRPHGQNPPAAVSPMAQVRNGPNGNFVIYERHNHDSCGTTGQPVYGKVSGNNPLRYQYPRAEGMYSNPPPPLPYRPPPPNPYQSPPNHYHQQQQQQQQHHQTPGVRPQSPKTYHTPPSTKYQNGGSPFVAKRNEVAAGREVAAYNSGSDMASGSSSSGPSSIDSQLSKKFVSPESTPSKLEKAGSPKLYDDSLVVIERSNQVYLLNVCASI